MGYKLWKEENIRAKTLFIDIQLTYFFITSAIEINGMKFYV